VRLDSPIPWFPLLYLHDASRHASRLSEDVGGPRAYKLFRKRNEEFQSGEMLSFVTGTERGPRGKNVTESLKSFMRKVSNGLRNETNA
jgi:hypothetical protein